jgi:hypothetical protein
MSYIKDTGGSSDRGGSHCSGKQKNDSQKNCGTPKSKSGMGGAHKSQCEKQFYKYYIKDIANIRKTLESLRLLLIET